MLGMFQYAGVDPDKPAPWTNEMVTQSEPIYTALFTSEAVIKIIAMGFIKGEKAYLRDAWNWLDFIVVITGLLTSLP